MTEGLRPHEIVVFLGPSLAPDTARRILPARYLPPAACGDVLRALRLRPKIIALVDGVFESIPAVWHKEILLAMEQGIAVFGASSMGALRAAELAPFGMVGVGRVFELYRDGVYMDDDEVAVLHLSAAGGYRALSEPMVNIRATVEHAMTKGVVGADLGALVIGCAKQTFYQERSVKDAVAKARAAGATSDEVESLLRFVENHGYMDQKRLDAVALLETLARLEASPANGRGRDHWVSRSPVLCALQVDVACRPFEQAQDCLPAEEKVAIEATSLGASYPLVCDLAQLLSLGDAVTQAHGTKPARDGLERLFDRDDFGLGPQAPPRWAEGNDLDDTAFAGFVDRLARIRARVESGGGGRRSARRTHKYLLAMLRIHGEYERFRGGKPGRGTRGDASVLRNLERQDGEKFVFFRRLAKLWRVVDEAARARGVAISPPPHDLQDFADRFRRARGLESRQATHAWLDRNNLDGARWANLMRDYFRLSILFREPQTVTLGIGAIPNDVCWFHDALRLTGLYTRLTRGTRLKRPREKRTRVG